MQHSDYQKIGLPDSAAELAIELGANDENQLSIATLWAFDIQDDDEHRPRGPLVARTLKALGADDQSLAAALLADPRLAESIDPKKVEEQFGPEVAALRLDVIRLNGFSEYQMETIDQPGQAEQLRRMLLAMSSDVRTVMIKLAFRLERLRHLASADYETRQFIAQETLDIYAPLANRLGLGQIKWEMEDLAFRFSSPQIYKRTAKLLEEKRQDREDYIANFVGDLEQALKNSGQKAKVDGRPKHIYSIWKKMQRKNLPFSELYDLRAVRVIVPELGDCYRVLGIAHGLWHPIAQEFDDYIANPKGNGYQSLHTAVYGEGRKPVEIQIRTQAMHDSAEMGVASHWRYKEGGQVDAQLERSIAHLRSLLDKVDKEDGDLVEEVTEELLQDRIYVRTPQGKLIDLAIDATPLDFAYSIHTDLGHSCRGAKVNGRIESLTHNLKTGDEIEILRGSESKPSPDWMNPNLGYLKSSRARAKVRHWFSHQDYDAKIAQGSEIYKQTLHKLGLEDPADKVLLRRFRAQNRDELYANIAIARISGNHLATGIQALQEKPEQDSLALNINKPERQNTPDSSYISGIGQLMSHIAPCCQPVPGDQISGFITLGKGVAIHRADCRNLINHIEQNPERILEISWGEAEQSTPGYHADIEIRAYDRHGLLRDVMAVIAAEKIELSRANSDTDGEQNVSIHLGVSIFDAVQLNRLIDKLRQLANVFDVHRKS